MPSKNKSELLEKMSSICSDQSALKARIAMISLFGDSQASTFRQKSLLLLEYLQLISTILLFALSFVKAQEESLANSLLFVAKLINPGLWLPLDNLSSFEMIVLIGLSILTICKYLLLAWIIYKFLRGSQPQSLVTRAWRTLYCIQGRVLYFGMTLFWTNLAMTSPLNGNLIEGTRRISRTAMSLFMIILDLVFSLLLYGRYHYVLPLKSFLSSKDNVVEIITLVQKFVSQMLVIFLSMGSEASIWAVIVLNVSADVIRNLYFFKTLPLYKYQAMNYQVNILMILTAINLTCLVTAIGRSQDSEVINLTFFVYLWVILSLLFIKLARQSLKRRFWNLIFNLSLANPSLLIHRVIAIKELRSENKNDSEPSDKFSCTSLLYQTVNKNIESILGVHLQKKIDLNDKKTANLAFKKHFERLVERSPQDGFLQLFEAYHSVKKHQKYGDAAKTIKILQTSGSENLKLNAEILLIQIQKELQEKAAERNRKSQIDPTSYLQEQGLFFRLQLSMLKQANTQIKVCQEMMKEVPDTFKIHQTAQICNRLRKNNTKTMDKLLHNLSESNLEPLLLYIHYSLSLNHSLEDYSRFQRIYSYRLSKYQKYFDQEALCKDNIFQNNTGLYFLSGHKSNAGTIMFAPKALGTRSGIQFNMLPNVTMLSRFAPCFKPIYANFYKNAAENNDERLFNQASPALIYHENGYLVEVTYHLSIHPYVTQGYYFVVFLRPIISNRESMLIHENGDIDCGTKRISERFGLLGKKKINIREVSEELAIVNKTFNMMAFPERFRDGGELTMEAAKEIYDLYMTTGKDVWLTPLDSAISYSYNCKIINKIYGTIVIKAFTFEENGFKANRNIEIQQNPTEEFHTGKDEKEHGWIEFDALTTQRVQTSLIPREETRTDTTSRHLLSSPMPLLESEKKPLSLDYIGKTKQITSNNLCQGSQEMEEEEERSPKVSSALTPNHLGASSQRKKLASLFKKSLEYKYSPKIFKGASILSYVALVAYMFSQCLTINAVNKNLENFTAQKDLLRNFQLRNYYLISLEGITRLLHDVQIGVFNTSGIRTFANGMGTARSLSRRYLANLVKANQELLQDAQYFDEKINNILFTKDIPVYYTYFDEVPEVFVEETSFGLIDRVVAATITVLNYNGTSAGEIKETAQFVFRNCLNDVLIKTQSISETIKDFLNHQRENIRSQMLSYLTGLLVTIVLGFAVFLFFLWKQYRKEVENLSVFCRIGNKKVEDVLKGFVRFKEMIEDQRSMSKELSSLMRAEKPLVIEQTTKRDILKESNNKGLQRKYYIYGGIYMAFLSVVVGLIVVGGHLTTVILDAFKEEQEQIYFIDYMRTRLTLSRQSARELLASNNTARIEYRLPWEELDYLLEEIKEVRTMIYDKLLDEKTVKKIPEIKTMLLEEACGLINLPEATHYCEILSEMDKKTGLIYMLDEYEDELTKLLIEYEASDKSADSIMEMQRDLYTLVPSLFVVLGNGALTLSDMIDAELEVQLEENKKEKDDYLVACTVLSVVIGCLMWVFILRRLKEGVNEFKNVLKIFPAEVILGSFILKNFLKKTSNCIFDQIRN